MSPVLADRDDDRALDALAAIRQGGGMRRPPPVVLGLLLLGLLIAAVLLVAARRGDLNRGPGVEGMSAVGPAGVALPG